MANDGDFKRENLTEGVHYLSNPCQKACEPQFLSPFLFHHELSSFALPDIPPSSVFPTIVWKELRTDHCLKPSNLQGKQNQTFSPMLLTMMWSWLHICFGSGEQGVLWRHTLYTELNGNQGVTSSSHTTLPYFTYNII